MAPAPVVSTSGQVAAGYFMVKVTVLPEAVTLFIAEIRLSGPFGSLILLIRSNEYTTSAPVTGSPLEKYWLGSSLQT